MATTVQNSITIRKLRNGDSLFLTLETNGIPLFQGVDSTTGAINPDWTVSDNQPIIIPNVKSVKGNTVVLSNHSWAYNGTTIIFPSIGSSGWVTDRSGQFSMNRDNGSIRIIDNLVNTDDITNAVLTYSGTATSMGVSYNLTKSIDIIIQEMGASSYYGEISAATQQLTGDVTSSVLTTSLFTNTGEVTDYYVRWYKDDTLWLDPRASHTLTIDRSDVDGSQLFIAEFLENVSDVTPLYRAGIRIIDTADDYVVNISITSTNKEVDTNKPVTVTAQVINLRTNSAVSTTGMTWKMYVMEKETWAILKSSSTNSITVTTTETDRNGEQNSVEVIAEATWN